LQVAVERGQLLRKVVLLGPRDDEHRGANRDLVPQQRDRHDLVVLLLQERAGRGVAALAVDARRVALAVSRHPGHRLPLPASPLPPRHGLAGRPGPWGARATSVSSRGFENTRRRPSLSTTSAPYESTSYSRASAGLRLTSTMSIRRRGPAARAWRSRSSMSGL